MTITFTIPETYWTVLVWLTAPLLIYATYFTVSLIMICIDQAVRGFR